MTEQNFIRWEHDADGIVTLTMDAPDASANTMSQQFVDALGDVVNQLTAQHDSITGVVLTSAKKTFFAGGDLKELIQATPQDAAEIFEDNKLIKLLLRRLETLGKPVVAAINGAALGGGLEIALACHHRIALDAKGSAIGLPEVTLGLLPGAGGVVRSVRLLGIADALTKVLLQGQRHTPRRALELGLVDEVVEDPEALLDKAKQWIKANPAATQPWDLKGYKMPGGAPASPSLAAILPSVPATLRKQLKGAPMPAPRNILCAAVEGAQVDVDTAFDIEGRYFVELVTGQVAKNMTKAFFFDFQHIKNGGSRPAGHPSWQDRKVGVLGAGLMGSGIAYVCARAGMDVVLKDVSLESAEKGKAYSTKIVEKSRGAETSTQQTGQLLDRITPTADVADLADCDLVIEAVFENPELKKRVLAEAETVVTTGCLIGSNTSTLPITGLAEGVKDQANFIGLHFFSPVEKMPLLEIVVGRNTSDATLAKAIDLAGQIGKTPIVVNDSRGFFTSRVSLRFGDEAIAMVGEGIAPASIEQAALQAGYPAGPLALTDDLTLTLPRQIREETKAAWIADGKQWQDHGSAWVLDRLIDEFDRRGRSSGGGFYDYDGGKRVGLWPGLKDVFAPDDYVTIPFDDMQERMLFAEAIDAIRCFEEGVLRSAADANVGSIFGIGFPAWTGGVVQYIEQYEGGVAGFIKRADDLAAKYGPRFAVPASLISAELPR